MRVIDGSIERKISLRELLGPEGPNLLCRESRIQERLYAPVAFPCRLRKRERLLAVTGDRLFHHESCRQYTKDEAKQMHVTNLYINGKTHVGMIKKCASPYVPLPMVKLMVFQAGSRSIQNPYACVPNVILPYCFIGP